MSRRVVLLAVALVLALAGTTAVFAYVSTLDARAAAQEQQFSVLVAREVIPAGTSGQQAQDAGLVELMQVPRRTVPAGALQDLTGMSDQVLGADVHAGEMLLQPKFVSAQQAGTMEIPDDKVAVTVKLTDHQRVAEFVRPGSEVAVFDTYEVQEPVAEPMPGGSAAQWVEGDASPVVKSATRLLLPRATVIAVGPTALRSVGAAPAQPQEESGAGGQDEPAALVTLAVSIEDAQELAHAGQVEPIDNGGLYLALLSEKSRTGTGVNTPDDNRTIFD